MKKVFKFFSVVFLFVIAFMLGVLYKENELKDVLIGLGYKEKELKPVLAKVDTSLPIEGQVKDALKLLLR